MKKSVLITGASTGLGLATALHLAKRGFHVYATAPLEKDRIPIQKAAQSANANIRFLVLDITQPASIESAVNEVLSQSGGIFALINNAGTRLRGCFEDLTETEIRTLFRVNVFGTMNATRAVVPHMRAARFGRIVVITSIAGRIGSFGVSAYCATKFALEGFSESLAQELAAFNIHVTIVEPGIINTEAWSLNRVMAAGSSNSRSPYFDYFQQWEKLADKMVESSTTTSLDVAGTIEKALTVTHPKLRYMVGRRARIINGLRRYLPADWFERVYFKTLIHKIISPIQIET